jgi:hypothetical protein
MNSNLTCEEDPRLNEHLCAFPIINFRSDKPEFSYNPNVTIVSFDPDTRIRELTVEEKDFLLYQKIVRHPNCYYCLETKLDSVVPIEKANLVVSALRLLKSGPVGANSFFYAISDMVKGAHDKHSLDLGRLDGSTTVDSFSKGGISPSGATSYVLKEDEKARLIALHIKINGIRDHKLSLALEHFNMSYSTRWPEKEILDLLIALETLYLDGASEKKFRLTCYVTSTLSSSSEENGEEIWRYISEAYDLRSNLVHRGEALPEKILLRKGTTRTQVSAEDLLKKIDHYTRQSIIEFITRGKKASDIQSDIENELKQRICRI